MSRTEAALLLATFLGVAFVVACSKALWSRLPCP